MFRGRTEAQVVGAWATAAPPTMKVMLTRARRGGTAWAVIKLQVIYVVRDSQALDAPWL